MEEATKALLQFIGQHGIGAVVAAIGVALFLMERKAHTAERERHEKTVEKLMELTSESIKADAEHTAAIKTLTRVLEGIDRRL